MQLFVPTIGTLITLTQDWEFNLHTEYRNFAFWQLAFPNESVGATSTWGSPFNDKDVRLFALKKGTVLRVDRIYIKKNAPDFDSITFVMKRDGSGEISKRPRFWVKLADANKIVCELGEKDG